MYQKIMVPLDGSERAEGILPHVEDLAQRYQATVIFMQVIEPEPLIMGPDVIYPMVNQNMVEERTEAAKNYLASLQARYQDKLKTATHVGQGPVVEAIIRHAERIDVDLIAMASHGRTGLSRVFYGSVAAGVLNKIDRPLLLIRSQNG